MKRTGVAALILAAAIGGCAAGSSDPVKQLPERWAKGGFIDTIDIKSLPENVSPEFRQTLITKLQEATKVCAAGKDPMRLQVQVVQFKKQNPALTYLIGDSNLIRGSAQLINPADGSVVGDYEITRSMGGGGLIAAAAMSAPESQMTEQFANELCKQAFGHDPSLDAVQSVKRGY